MAATQLATKVDMAVKKAVEEFCGMRGIKMCRFIEDALIDKLEEFEDIEDLRSLRKESSRPLSAVIRDLKANGKI